MYNLGTGSDTLYTRVTELTFKRYVISAGHEVPPFGVVFIYIFMDIFVYSDESGVFDVSHNEYFVFGGLILLGKRRQRAL